MLLWYNVKGADVKNQHPNIYRIRQKMTLYVLVILILYAISGFLTPCGHWIFQRLMTVQIFEQMFFNRSNASEVIVSTLLSEEMALYAKRSFNAT